MVWDWVLGSRILIQNTWCVIGFWDVVIFSRATHNASHLHCLEQHGSLPGCYLKPLNTSESAFFLFFQQTTTCQFHSLVCSHLTHHLPVSLTPSARLTHHLTSSHIISHTICLFPYHLPQGFQDLWLCVGRVDHVLCTSRWVKVLLTSLHQSTADWEEPNCVFVLSQLQVFFSLTLWPAQPASY